MKRGTCIKNGKTIVEKKGEFLLLVMYVSTYDCILYTRSFAYRLINCAPIFVSNHRFNNVTTRIRLIGVPTNV